MSDSILFIDIYNNPLFEIENGQSIILTHFDGNKETLNCRYIDDSHAVIGEKEYSPMKFAKETHENGTVYMPAQPKTGDIYDTYEIYQIMNTSTDYCFINYDRAKVKIKPNDYTKVYAGMLADKTTPEDIFIEHNRDGRPFGRRMRSLSVSDIIVLKRGGKSKAYYTDSFGFKELPFTSFLERCNQGYLIIDSIKVGNKEFVLGVNSVAVEPYVTWQYKDGEYNWGHYMKDYISAKEDLKKRAGKERNSNNNYER